MHFPLHVRPGYASTKQLAILHLSSPEIATQLQQEWNGKFFQGRYVRVSFPSDSLTPPPELYPSTEILRVNITSNQWNLAVLQRPHEEILFTLFSSWGTVVDVHIRYYRPFPPAIPIDDCPDRQYGIVDIHFASGHTFPTETTSRFSWNELVLQCSVVDNRV